MKYFLGADVGSSKTHILIADENGRAAGFGNSGPGNHQVVGYGGMFSALQDGLNQALSQAGISVKDVHGSGFGISGYDWPSDKPKLLEGIARLQLEAPVDIHNDAVLGLVAGAENGWGIAVVSGSGCNCWGWDRGRKQVGRVTGFGDLTGEGAGGSELVSHAMQLVAHQWTKRGQQTALSDMFIQYAGASDLTDLLEGYTTGYYQINAEAALQVFQVAEGGDQVAMELIRWAGTELGELAKAVIRQLNFETIEFDVVLVGSMFDGGALLIDPMRENIQGLAPGARLVRLNTPPVVGALLIGMEAGGLQPSPEIRAALIESLS